ncbi:MAG: carbohydrate diacid regulator, partial [Synergistales bacterium]|nr:carbohydrate diacid regulator [Synergistales bacterium]
MLEPIAQELALSIAEVIGYDVLITDVDGIIIGCSDPDRGLGTLNESSRIAARTGRGSVDTEDVAKLLKGTRPGVTYPVVDLENRVIGTVAITGDPDKVKPFALVVKRQAELYIRERTVMKEVLERERNLQTLISDIYLFKPRINDPDLVSNRAEQFGYDSSLSYSALAFEIRRVPGYRDTVGRDRLLLRLKECFGGARSIVGAMKLDLYVA